MEQTEIDGISLSKFLKDGKIDKKLEEIVEELKRRSWNCKIFTKRISLYSRSIRDRDGRKLFKDQKTITLCRLFTRWYGVKNLAGVPVIIGAWRKIIKLKLYKEKSFRINLSRQKI